MNNIVDLYNILLSEGLIRSIEEYTAVDLLIKNFHDIDASVKDSLLGGPSIIINTLYFPDDNYGHNKYMHQRLLQFINNLGWYPSMIKLFDMERFDFEDYAYNPKYADRWFKLHGDNAKLSYALLIEKKYDYILHDVPKYLYHLAPTKNIPKILHIGLTPRTRVKLSTHPERIYLALTIKGLDMLEPQFVQITGDQYVRLKIDTSKWLAGTKLYKDPNFKGYGVYVLKNIPPNAITVIK